MLLFAFAILALAAICRAQHNDDDNPCGFQDDYNCNVLCEDASVWNLEESVQFQWNLRPKCRQTGVHLTLRNMQFADSHLAFPWNHTDMSVGQLSLEYTEMTTLYVQPLTFRVLEFNALRILHFVNIRTADQLRAGTFAGLPQLEELLFDNTTFADFAAGALDDVRQTLRVLSLRESTNRILARSLQPMLGNTTFPLLDTLTVRDNLADTIDARTFRGLPALFALDLARCNIGRLAAGSFDPLTGSLHFLNLAGNRLTTLPAGLFASFVGRAYRIDLDDNPWHCDCALLELQRDLADRVHQIFGTLLCATPAPCLTTAPVSTAVMCEDDGHTDAQCWDGQVEGEGTRPPGDEGEDTEDISGHPAELHDRYVTRNCLGEADEHCEEIQFKGQTKIKDMSLEPNGEVAIEIVDDVSPSDVVIIWFETIKTQDDYNEYYESSNDVMCRSSSVSRFRVGPLMADTAYTLCLVSKAETTVSPLDCMPYYNQTRFEDEAEDAWILEEDKVKVIALVVCGAVVSLLFGVAMSFVLIRRHPGWLKGRRGGQRAGSAASSAAAAAPGAAGAMPPDWSRQRDSKSHRYSDVSIISDGRSYSPGADHPKMLLEKQHRLAGQRRQSALGALDSENKYYLDYMPHKVPPPLPPPNTVPVLYGLARSQMDNANVENYYSQVGVKNKK